AETATDPAPLTMIETFIQFKPRDQWREGMTTDKLIKELDAVVKLPGVTNAWVMPIKTRIDMLATGIKTPIGIKLMGDNLDELGQLGERIEAILRFDPDVLSVYSERVVGGNYID
ncbi:MAG: CusA/CzcA family heavy metal efflux RND transporter, partial [Phototrophicales bacterium]